MRALSAMASVLLLAACQPTTDAAIGDMAATPSDCAARGGTLQRVGRAQTMQCVIAYADAGKRCTDGAQCQGDCRVEDAPFPDAGAVASGVCQADSRPFGCHARVEDGRAAPAICVD